MENIILKLTDLMNEIENDEYVHESYIDNFEEIIEELNEYKREYSDEINFIKDEKRRLINKVRELNNKIEELENEIEYNGFPINTIEDEIKIVQVRKIYKLDLNTIDNIIKNYNI